MAIEYRTLGTFNGDKHQSSDKPAAAISVATLDAACQREAVARLTTACESIINRGLLDHDEEFALRTFVNIVCNAFDMAPVQDEERVA